MVNRILALGVSECKLDIDIAVVIATRRRKPQRTRLRFLGQRRARDVCLVTNVGQPVAQALRQRRFTQVDARGQQQHDNRTLQTNHQSATSRRFHSTST